VSACSLNLAFIDPLDAGEFVFLSRRLSEAAQDSVHYQGRSYLSDALGGVEAVTQSLGFHLMTSRKLYSILFGRKVVSETHEENLSRVLMSGAPLVGMLAPSIELAYHRTLMTDLN
jgi:hypothetical protein